MLRWISGLNTSVRSTSAYSVSKSIFSQWSSPMSYKYSSAASNNSMFDKILIANRGEIACRVIRTARKLGVKTVAVYSDADAKALHVQMADEAVRIGPPETVNSYLRGDKIIEACKLTGAQAVHPGYGFLSENAGFAQLCQDNGVVFIGPPPGAITKMGSKSESKKIMENASVPVVPGYHGEAQDFETLRQHASKIKYPIMIKAVMGGGGRGMRTCFNEADLEELINSASREAANAFGDSRVLLEKYITKPRHIELQVFADTHGNCVYVFERDCSVQRRNQKVIEEAPAPGLTPERRKIMGEAAVNAAKAVGYVGAGTVEFIVDTDNPDPNSNFYFMEMNTRLQVEHPVSEMIANQDLVEWQLMVASGQTLPLTQDQLQLNGHAFEARIYAEDPSKGFIPGYGKIKHLRAPEQSPNVRVDTGVTQGDGISTYYDNMIAKLIVWDQDRTRALQRMRLALSQYQIVGLVTNTAFLKQVVDHPAFIKGEVTTSFIPTYEKDLLPQAADKVPSAGVAIAAISTILREHQQQQQSAQSSRDPSSPFVPSLSNYGYRINGDRSTRRITLQDGEHKLNVRVQQKKPENHQQTELGFEVHIERQVPSGPKKAFHSLPEETLEVFAISTGKPNEFQVTVDNRQRITATVVQDGDNLEIFFDGGESHNHYQLQVPVLKSEDAVANKSSLLSPMPGVIKKVAVKEGDEVKKGQVLVVVYAMKTELPVKAGADGIVKKVHYKVDETVEAGSLLVSMKEEEEEK